MNSLALTGLSGPLGIVAPGGLLDLTGGDKKAAAAPAVAAPVPITAAGISPTALIAGGAALLFVLLAVRR